MNNYYNINEVSKLNEDDQKRIKYLRIPPNWKSVKISKDSSSKIQVTGKDDKGRTQYIYHPVWVQFSKETKYSKIDNLNFNSFENIINKFSKYNQEFTKNYVIANMFIIMKDLNIRVGNEKYLEENDSVGLCTLSKSNYKKINVENKIVNKFIFKGKKGIIHEKILEPKHVIFIENIIKIPGKFLFKYYQNNSYKKIIADDLNQFLKDNVDKSMSCKDIRTYCANNIFKKEYSKLLKDGIIPNKARIEATKITAINLGNTPKVCRDSYIDPSLYLEN